MKRLLLCSDQPVLAVGLRKILEKGSDWQLIGIVRRIDQLAALLHFRPADIVLIDMSEDVSAERLSDLRETCGEARIVLMGRSLSPELAYYAQEIRVAAFVATTVDPEELLLSLEMVAEGKSPPNEALRHVSDRTMRISLSNREGQLVTLLAQGLKNKEIAECLGIAEGTVKVYLSKLYQKVGAKDRLELALFGLRNEKSSHAEHDREALRSSSAGGTVCPMRSLVLPRIPAREAEDGEALRWRKAI